ncbi:Uncharacterized protein APZ42_031450 [Daphnia magna]|uniref:Zinc finger BED domain-containing-like protein n=1 Tax=Daphnia magna TaxID=35525 RepID=A0A164MUQ2_9CRUS|nr:Uncharacterized protein APZ42_031450 [Daphnia magna]
MSKQLHTKHSTMLTKIDQSGLNSKGKVVKPFKVIPIIYNEGSAHDAFIEFIATNSCNKINAIINNYAKYYNNHGFALGEEAAFRKFTSKLQPLYKFLEASDVKDRLMRTYAKMKQKVIEQLGKIDVALTTDLWTSPNNFSFLGITIAMWNETFQPIDVIVEFKYVLGDHSGVNLAKNFYNNLTSYQLNDKVSIIFTD